MKFEGQETRGEILYCYPSIPIHVATFKFRYSNNSLFNRNFSIYFLKYFDLSIIATYTTFYIVIKYVNLDFISQTFYIRILCQN